mmetsp:Transcript_18823/g.36910  ORF Transcript_18823/g.36910 Transcript_18823/m.36910 type:complete len:1272 (+) Transcript_18823:282-4097(+)
MGRRHSLSGNEVVPGNIELHYASTDVNQNQNRYDDYNENLVTLSTSSIVSTGVILPHVETLNSNQSNEDDNSNGDEDECVCINMAKICDEEVLSEEQCETNNMRSKMLRKLLEDDRFSNSQSERIPNLRRVLIPQRDRSTTVSSSSSSPGLVPKFVSSDNLSRKTSSGNLRRHGSRVSRNGYYTQKTIDSAWTPDVDVPMTPAIERLLYFASEDQGRFTARRRASDMQNQEAAATLQAVLGTDTTDEIFRDSLDVKPYCCGLFQRKWKFRNLVLITVLCLQIVTIIVLVLPSATLMAESTQKLEQGCSLSSGRLLNLTTNEMMELSETLGKVTTSTLFERLLGYTLQQPLHVTNSLSDSLLYTQQILDTLGNNLTLGAYSWNTSELENQGVPEKIDESLWRLSAGPLMINQMRSNSSSKLSKVFIFQNDQYMDVQIKHNKTNILQAATMLVHVPKTTLSNDQVGGVYNIDFETWTPGHLSQTISIADSFDITPGWASTFLLSSSAQDTFASTNTSLITMTFSAETKLLVTIESANSDGRPLQGAWSELSDFSSILATSFAPGYAYGWPWAPCGNSSCVKGYLGALITLHDISSYSNMLVNEILLSLTAVRAWISDGALLETVDENNFQQIMANESAASNNLLSPLTAQQFSALIDQAVAFMIVISSDNQQGLLAANSRDPPLDVAMALDAGNPTIRNVTRMLLETYGVFDLSNHNYSNAIAQAVHAETMSPCLYTNAMVKPEDILECLLVSASIVHVEADEHFASNNMLTFLHVVVVPYITLLGNLTSTIDAVQAAMNEFTQDSEKVLQHSNIIEGVLAAVLLVISSFLAFALATTVSTPLQRLKYSMRQLRDLNFLQLERFHSRIQEINSVQSTFSALRNTMRVVEKFIPKPVVRQIFLNEDNARDLNVTSRVVTIMFSDLRGFTTMGEVLRPDELLGFLTHYVTVMTRIIEAYEGTIGEIQGDGILAFWNTPDLVDDHAAKACSSALAQQEALMEINELLASFLQSYGLGPLGLRIGIHTGRVLTGNIGSLAKLKFGCIGDSINLASRLEGTCKLYGVPIICSDDTHECLPNGVFRCRKLDLVTVKGKVNPTMLYQILAQEKSYQHTRCARVINASLADEIKKYLINLSNSNTFSGRAHTLSSPNNSTLSWLPGVSVSEGLRSIQAATTSSKRTKRKEHAKVLVCTEFLPSKTLSDNEKDDALAYEQALAYYGSGDFGLAKDILDGLHVPDEASIHLLARVNACLQVYAPPASIPLDWNGVLHLDEKNF